MLKITPVFIILDICQQYQQVLEQIITIAIREIESQDGDNNNINGAETKSYNASVNVNYTLFDGLGRKYNYKQLKETYNLSELQARETIENMYLQLFNVYFQIARLSENTKNLNEALEDFKTKIKKSSISI